MAIQDNPNIQIDKAFVTDKASQLHESALQLLNDWKAYSRAMATSADSANSSLKNAGLPDIQLGNGIGPSDNGTGDNVGSPRVSAEASAREKTGLTGTASGIAVQENAVGSAEPSARASAGGLGQTEHWGSIELTPNGDGNAVVHIQRGDNLWKVAREVLKHDSGEAPTTRETANEAAAIIKANGGKLADNPDHVQIGQDIVIPKRSHHAGAQAEQDQATQGDSHKRQDHQAGEHKVKHQHPADNSESQSNNSDHQPKVEQAESSEPKCQGSDGQAGNAGMESYIKRDSNGLITNTKGYEFSYDENGNLNKIDIGRRDGSGIFDGDDYYYKKNGQWYSQGGHIITLDVGGYSPPPESMSVTPELNQKTGELTFHSENDGSTEHDRADGSKYEINADGRVEFASRGKDSVDGAYNFKYGDDGRLSKASYEERHYGFHWEKYNWERQGDGTWSKTDEDGKPTGEKCADIQVAPDGTVTEINMNGSKRVVSMKAE